MSQFMGWAMFFNSELVKLFYSWLENTWILLGCHNMFVRDSPNRDFRSTASDDKEIKILPSPSLKSGRGKNKWLLNLFCPTTLLKQIIHPSTATPSFLLEKRPEKFATTTTNGGAQRAPHHLPRLSHAARPRTRSLRRTERARWHSPPRSSDAPKVVPGGKTFVPQAEAEVIRFPPAFRWPRRFLVWGGGKKCRFIYLVFFVKQSDLFKYPKTLGWSPITNLQHPQSWSTNHSQVICQVVITLPVN